MAKVTGPLLSMGGTGQIGKTQVYASWKGRQYVRRFVVPANPNSDAQKLTRACFRYNFGLYRYATAGVIAAMAAAAKSARLTTPNMFNKANLSLERTNITNADLIVSPGYGGAPACPAVAVVAGTHKLSLTIPAPVLPAGWTAVPIMYGAAVEAWSGTGFADVGTDYTMVEASDATPSSGSYAFDITGLTTGTLYTVAAFFSVVRPDGVIAYSATVNNSGTPT
jgi:hypothetical protein